MVIARAGAMVIASALVVIACTVALSVACTVKLKVPDAEGMPLKTPALLRVKPPGKLPSLWIQE